MKDTQDGLSSANILLGAPEDVPLRAQQDMRVTAALPEPP